MFCIRCVVSSRRTCALGPYSRQERCTPAAEMYPLQAELSLVVRAVNYPMKKYSFPDIPWVVPVNYFPCPHLHLRPKTFNREYLTRSEHFNLLATPKGYRWYSKSESYMRRSIERKSAKKSSTPPKPPFPGFRQFMAEIWNILTPDMIERLIEILQEELEMSKEEAIELLFEQRAKAMRLAKAEVFGPAPRVTTDDICWAKNMSSTLAKKITLFTEMRTVAPRGRRVVKLKKHLVRRLHRLFGLEAEGDYTPVRSLLYWSAESIATWINSLPTEKNLDKICDQFKTVYSALSLL